MPNRKPSYIILSDFFHFLLISRVWASIKEAAKKIQKCEFPAKLHPPECLNLPRCRLTCLSLEACNLVRSQRN